jgi:hypothetical protein
LWWEWVIKMLAPTKSSKLKTCPSPLPSPRQIPRRKILKGRKQDRRKRKESVCRRVFRGKEGTDGM